MVLCIYPIETIFAEKLKTVVSKGAANGRMNDFRDLLLISRVTEGLDGEELKIDEIRILRTETSQKTFPLDFSTEDLISMNRLWIRHLRTVANLGAFFNINGGAYAASTSSMRQPKADAQLFGSKALLAKASPAQCAALSAK